MASSPPASDEEFSPQKPLINARQLNLADAGILELTDDGLGILRSPDAHESPGYLEHLSSCLRSNDDQQAQHILYRDLLYASLADHELTISFAKRTSKTATLHTRTFAVPSIDIPSTTDFITQLLQRAYAHSQIHKRIKVLINPHGGRGRAQQIYNKHIAPVFAAAHCSVSVEATTHFKHAEAIAQQLDTDAWDVVACCSGDGVPHEVFNGLATQQFPQRALRKIAVVQLPCGSGNGMSWNLTGTDDPVVAALAVVKGVRMPMDLVSVTQGERRMLSFLSQAVGIIAESDLGTEHMRWLGDTRFTIGYVQRLLKKTLWPVDVAIGVAMDDKTAIKRAYHRHADAARSTRDWEAALELSAEDEAATSLPALKFGTVNDALPAAWQMKPYLNLGNFWAGNMAYMSANSNVFSTSLPADGLMDLMCVDGDKSRRRALALADMTATGVLIDAPEVNWYKVVGYRIVPRQAEGYVSIDGERVDFKGFQAEVHRGLGTVLGSVGGLYAAKGPALVD